MFIIIPKQNKPSYDTPKAFHSNIMTTMAVDGESDDSITMLSSCWRYILSFFSLLHKLKENQSEKLSIILRPGDNSEWRSKKEGKIPLNLLFVSTKWSLTWNLWRLVRVSSKAGCQSLWVPWWDSIIIQMRWLGGKKWACNYDLLPSFCKSSLMGMRPTIASICCGNH